MRYGVNQRSAVRLPTWRRRVLLVAVISFFGLLALQSINLQSTKRDFLQKKGDSRYARTLKLAADRGKITDRTGEILAISGPVKSVWANPKQMKISAKQRVKLAKLLGMKPGTVSKKVSNKKKEFVYLKRRISPELAEKVAALEISGIHMENESRRFYPAGDVMAHVVGFTGVDGYGQEGIEYMRNDTLSGEPGKRRVIQDRARRIVEELAVIKAPRDGQDLTLSIDHRIQYYAFRELAKAATKYQAKAASAVVLDAKSGEILAMVNLPTYNPNNPRNLRGKTRNRALTDIFEPGSTMKPITIAAGMEFGGFTPTTHIKTTKGRMRIGSATIRDAHPSDGLTVAQVVQKSSNVGSARIALTLDKRKMWSTFNELGFGARTSVRFPGEASGKVRDYKTWKRIEQATMSYGHGISVTLLQLARSYTVFANNGELKPVSLMKVDNRAVGKQVFSPKVANDVKAMLEMVVQPGGTGIKAQIAGYRVGGKTGTAHKLGPKGYEKDKYVGSFVGLAPISNPRYIMAVMIDEPTSGEYYGGTVAAPVFSAVMSEVLRLMAVPQDAPNNNVVIPTPEALENVREVI